MVRQFNRREFLTTLGAAASAVAGQLMRVSEVTADEPPRGYIANRPYKIGHTTFFTGPAAILGDTTYKGLLLAAKELNAQGGLLGRRKIEILNADEAAGLDANVKELRRMKFSERIDLFSGVLSDSNVLELAPVAEEQKILTIFTGGSTDRLFDAVDPTPKYVFRVPHTISTDAATCAVAVAITWPEVRTVAHIHPDYVYGRTQFEHFTLALQKLLPETQIVSQEWPKLFTRDFTPYLTKITAAKPDLLVTSIWGGDYINFYKQALRYGSFDQVKVATMDSFAVPHAIGKDHPERVISGVGANYYFTYAPEKTRPINKLFVERYFERFKEYPSFLAEAAYTGLYLLKAAIEKANKATGGWPDDEATIKQLEGLSLPAPGGSVYVRPDTHQVLREAVTSYSRKDPKYPFATWDLDRVISIPATNITAPANWPKPGQGHSDPTTTYNWIKTAWPSSLGLVNPFVDVALVEEHAEVFVQFRLKERAQVYVLIANLTVGERTYRSERRDYLPGIAHRMAVRRYLRSSGSYQITVYGKSSFGSTEFPQHLHYTVR